MVDYTKLKKGDSFVLRNRKGMLLTDPEYLTDERYGLFYADVKWDNGKIEPNFMICRTNIIWNL